MQQSNGSVEENKFNEFVSSVTSSAVLKVEEKLGHGFVRLKVAEAERRQAFHDIRTVEDVARELIRNSRDAGAGKIFIGFQKEKGRYRRITILDDGCGIPSDMHSLIFEPRVTSRCENFKEDVFGVHGRGMALFSIKSRVDDIRIISSVNGFGTSMAVVVDTEKLPERSDQATMPSLIRTTDGYEIGTGPHNVNRLLIEFSIDSIGPEYYIGSFAEVVSTLYSESTVMRENGIKCIWMELGEINDAKEISVFAEEKLGIPISERNSYRILNGEIPPLETVMRRSKVSFEDSEEKRATEILMDIDKEGIETSLEKNRLKILKKKELEEIGEGVKTVTAQVLEQYYLKVKGEPKVKRGRGKITISVHISENDQ